MTNETIWNPLLPDIGTPEQWRAEDLAFVNEQLKFFRTGLPLTKIRGVGHMGGLKVAPRWIDPEPGWPEIYEGIQEIIRLLEIERIKVIKENPYGKKAYDRWLVARQEDRNLGGPVV